MHDLSNHSSNHNLNSRSNFKPTRSFKMFIQSLRDKLSQNPLLLGHLLAIFSILIQSARLTQTKSLLASFSPLQILFIAFFIAYIFFLCLRKRLIFYGI